MGRLNINELNIKFILSLAKIYLQEKSFICPVEWKLQKSDLICLFILLLIYIPKEPMNAIYMYTEPPMTLANRVKKTYFSCRGFLLNTGIKNV